MANPATQDPSGCCEAAPCTGTKLEAWLGHLVEQERKVLEMRYGSSMEPAQHPGESAD